MSDNLKNRDSVILSVHPHNDRGCGVADTELALWRGRTGWRGPSLETVSAPETWISSPWP